MEVKMSRLSAIDVANYFVSLNSDGNLTNLKVQKLVYYAYGLHLALYEKKLFDDEIEAWDYGPVIPALYHEFKEFNDYPIKLKELFDIDIIGDKKEFLQDVYTKYAKYNARTLCNLTHQKSTPWDVVYHDKSSNYIINDELLRVYFSELTEVLTSDKNIDQFHAAKILSKDTALAETMYILSHPKNAQELIEALECSAKGEIIEFDWRNAS